MSNFYEETNQRRTFQNTLSFLVAIAWQKLFPNENLEIGQAMQEGIYYCKTNPLLNQVKPISLKEIEALKKEMNRLIAANFPIKKREIAYMEAIEYFSKINRHSAISLLEFKNDPTITLFELDGILDLASSPLAESTATISAYKIQPYEAGFILHQPKNLETKEFSQIENNSLLFGVYNEYRNWSRILNITCVGELNKLIQEKTVGNFIMINEILQEHKIAAIANQIYQNKDRLKVVFIAGPSSSGKTTFTKKLSIHLQVFGIRPTLVEMDDYYRPRSETPLDAEGKPDYESLEALDIPLLNQQMQQLFRGEKVEIPIYDFKSGTRKEKGRELQIEENGILIMEGIHGLNPDLSNSISRKQKFLIYLSALTQLKLDDHNRIHTSDNRLIRRIVRDAQFRGTPSIKTFEMWGSVRSGEKRNIFPYQGNADVAFNSALNYELPILKTYAEPLLRTVKPDDPSYNEARRLQALLDFFLPIPRYEVPNDSILTEFVGGSRFHY